MEQLEILHIIELLEDNMELFPGYKDKKPKFLAQLESLKGKYQTVSIPEECEEIYEMLLKKGRVLLEQQFRVHVNIKKLYASIERYIAYLRASYEDFCGKAYQLTGFFRLFLICSILMFGLSPFVISPVFSFVFLLPIFLAGRGIKQRAKSGLTLALAIGLGGILTVVAWGRVIVMMTHDYPGMLTQFMTANGFNESISQILLIALPILSAVLLVACVWLFMKGYRVRNLFV